MYSSSLLQLLSTFTGTEIDRFGKFIQSPYFNTGDYIINFFEDIRKFYPALDSTELKKEKVFARLYPDREYNDATMRKLSSNLFGLAEDFLSIESLKKDKDNKSLYLLESYRNRNLDKLHRNECTKLEKSKDSDIMADTDYLMLHKLNAERFNYMMVKSDFKDVPKIQELIYKDLFLYLLGTLSIGIICNAGQTSTHRDKNEFNFSTSFLDYVDLQGLLQKIDNPRDSLYINLNYLIIKAYDEPSLRYYDELRNIIENNYDLFNEIEKYNLFTMLDNLSNLILAKGDEKEGLHERSHEVNKFVIKHGSYLLPFQRYMPLPFFRNFIVTAVHVKDIKSAEKFIEEHVNELQEKDRENMYCYGKAVVEFEKGNFEKSLEYAGKIKFDYSPLKTEIRKLLLKIYYELGYYENALSLVDSSLHFVKNDNKVVERRKASFENFVKVYRELLKFRFNGKDFAEDWLRQELYARRYEGENWMYNKFYEQLGDELDKMTQSVKYVKKSG